MSEPFIGEIRMVGFNFAPRGWALCNGQLLSIQSYTALFSLLGTSFGGNGTTTFGLPNLQGRVPIHQGNNGTTSYVLGETTGAEKVTLLTTNLPAHNHTINCDAQGTGGGGTSFAAGSGQTPSNNFPGLATAPAHAVYSPNHNATMNSAMVNNTGSSVPVSVVQPLLVVNFIIATVGIYPTRN